MSVVSTGRVDDRPVRIGWGCIDLKTLRGYSEASYQSAAFLERPPDARKYEKEFLALGPEEGVGGGLWNMMITGQKVKGVLEASKLNNSMLHKIWTLSDIDKDGKLTLYE